MFFRTLVGIGKEGDGRGRDEAGRGEDERRSCWEKRGEEQANTSRGPGGDEVERGGGECLVRCAGVGG